MGLPTRLHGDQVLNKPGLTKGFCLKCVGIREWEVIANKGVFYKRCVKCGTRREIKDPKVIIEMKKALSNQKRKQKKGGNKKKKDKK